ncbi:hypothetical protein B5F40_15460 [Gordonibacter sp. An230]|uniref:helix-turn-helix transcriptional regulator n=1 Tax=Gordonibacter sp. An230 TaxID=1965592 RepID=UPI000B37757D|nr:helix-turn-helix transcriptional regulator [Gordonibacter sp. An230]OUO86027.1 hypothetical protein B5F40_15460 [Gordonibacter sp. An230]
MGIEHNASSEGQERISDPLAPLQRIRPDLLGFIFHISWLFLLFYGGGLNVETATGIDPTDVIYLSSALALIATLGMGLARTKAFMRASESRIGAVAAPAVTALGTLLYCLDQSMPTPWLVWAAGLLTGIGSAVLAARWASVFGNVSSRTIIANFPTILAAVVVICVSIGYLPRWACLALLVVLPLCSGGALQFARRYQRGLPRPSSDRPEQGRSQGKRNALLVAFVALVGFTVALLPSFEVAGTNYGMLFYLVAGILVLGFAGTALFLADRRSFSLLFVAPLLVLAVVLLPFAQFAADSLGDVAYPVGSVAFELMLLFGTVLFALVTDQSPARIFMMGRMTLAVSDLAGAFLGERVADLGGTVIAQVASVCLFASCELLLAAVVVSYFANRRGKMRAEKAAEPIAPSTSLEQIVERFGLSEREREVFVLLAEGRSSARIQEDLCIAAGTANYHTRNIYQKLGVHSRQEVIDLVHRERLP